MKQHTRKFSILLFLVSLFISCSPEENFVKNKTAISLQDIKTKQINYSDFSRKTQYVKNKPDISPMISENQMARLAADTSDYVIYSDRIIETIFNDYTSYTMLLKTPNTTKNVYYNIVFEVRNNTTKVLILKYTKTESGILEETITAFRSSEDFPSGGAITLQMYLDDFENPSGGGSIGTPTSTGSGGMGWTGLGGSQIYPSNCNGTVTTTYVIEPHPCSKGHMPNGYCEYSDPNHSLYNPSLGPYYELVPYYNCVPNPSSGTTNPPTSGGGNTGGPNSPDPVEDTSITAMIKPIECTEPLPGDLDVDCQLSTYEQCLLDVSASLTAAQKAWWNDKANAGERAEIENYIADSGCAEESKEFAKKMINANIIVKQINTEPLDPCYKSVFQKIKNAADCDISKVLAKLEAGDSIYNTVIKTEDFSPIVPGKCERYDPTGFGPPLRYNYIIKMHPAYDNSTKLFKASILLHELIHAYFLSLMDDFQTGNNVSAFEEFPVLFEKFVLKKFPGDASQAHHQEMALKYVDAIARALHEYHTGFSVDDDNQPDQIYKDLAWGGLRHAPIFDTNFPTGSAERLRIINRYASEGTNQQVGSQSPIGGNPCND